MELDRSAEASLLAFYGLDTLTPEVWQEPPGSLSESMLSSPTAATITTPALHAQNTTVAPMPSTPISDEEYSLEWQNNDEDPLGIKESVFGRRNRNKGNIDPKLKASILIASRDFDAKKFLYVVHKNTSYVDLKKGQQRLQEAVARQTETMKTLVKTNFDRFVSAKSTVDLIYKQLKSKNLSSAGYGTEAFHQRLKLASESASSVFAPIIERRVKAEKIRTTLSVLDQFKFFFNLPASLEDSIQKNKFDQAVRDYKKGKELLRVTFPNLSLFQNTDSDMTHHIGDTVSPISPLAEFQTHQRLALSKVFENVWSEVERVVVTLRNKLFRELSDTTVGFDVHERTINYLIDIDAPEDPVWHLLLCQFDWISKLMLDAYTMFSTKMDTLKQQQALAEITAKESLVEANTTDVSSPVQLSSKQEVLPLPKSEPSPSKQEKEKKKKDAKKSTSKLVVKETTTFGSTASISIDPSKREKERMLKVANLEYMQKIKQARQQRILQSSKFRKSMAAVIARDYEVVFGREVETQMWMCHVKLVEHVSEVMEACLPDFWKLGRAFIEGRYYSKDRAKKRITQTKIEQYHNMFVQLCEMYASHIGRAFLSESEQRTITIPRRLSTASQTSQITTDTKTSPKILVSSPSFSVDKPNLPTENAIPMLTKDSVAASFFLPKISTILYDCFQECFRSIRNTAPPASLESIPKGDASSGLSTLQLLLEKVRRAFLEILTECWTKEATTFFGNEDWTIDPDSKDASSNVSLFYRFEKFMIREVFQQLTMVDLTRLDDFSMSRKVTVPPKLLDALKTSFMETLFAKLDGTHFLVFNSRAWSEHTSVDVNVDDGHSGTALIKPIYRPDGTLERDKTAILFATQSVASDTTATTTASTFTAPFFRAFKSTGMKVFGGDGYGLDNVRIDASKKEARMLVMLGNVWHLKSNVVPRLVTLFEELFRTTLGAELKRWMHAANYLDRLIFEAYLKRKSSKLNEIIRQGILLNGFDWTRASRPSNIQPYVNDALLYLVLAHSEINDVLGSGKSGLMDRILLSLIHETLQSFLISFREIDSFHAEGVVQAAADVLAIYHVVRPILERIGRNEAQVVSSDVIEHVFELVMETITHRSKKNAGSNVINVDGLVAAAQPIVRRWLAGVDVLMMCFSQ